MQNAENKDDQDDDLSPPELSRGRRAVKWMANNRLLQKARAAIPDSWARAIIRVLRSSAGFTGKLEKGKIGNVEVVVPNDKYWGRYGGDLNVYEPEVQKLIDRFADDNLLFIDCGANIGLWSSYAAAKIKDGSKVIAIEPGEETRPALLRNQKTYGFVVDHSAIYNEPDVSLSFNVDVNHAASSLNTGNPGRKPLRQIPVKTTTLDKIVVEHGKGNENIIVKLDVEGVEKEALEGASDMLAKNRNIMFIYEDHGNDPTSETTNHMLKKMNMHVYTILPTKTLSAAQITDAGQLANIKTCAGTGYNFVACRPGTMFDIEMHNLCEQVQTPEQLAAVAARFKSSSETRTRT